MSVINGEETVSWSFSNSHQNQVMSHVFIECPWKGGVVMSLFVVPFCPYIFDWTQVLIPAKQDKL